MAEFSGVICPQTIHGAGFPKIEYWIEGDSINKGTQSSANEWYKVF